MKNGQKVWYKKCKPMEYSKLKKEEPEIDDCLEENNIDPSDFNKIRIMLQGNYGGLTLLEHMTKTFNKRTFSKGCNLFTKEFLNTMKLMKPLFIGLVAMYTKKIGYNDIKTDNVVVQPKGSFNRFWIF